MATTTRQRRSSKEVLIENIKEAQNKVDNLVEELMKARKNLEELQDKLAEIQKKELIDALELSDKTIEDVIAFIKAPKTK